MAPQRNRRPGFSRRAQYALFLTYVLAAAGALLGAVLLALSLLDPPAYAVARGAIREVTTPVSSGLHAVRRGITGIPAAIGTYFAVHGENARLRSDIERNRGTIVRARQLVVENARLRRLLAVRERGVEPVATARLVNASASSTRRYATLNAGAWQGVRGGYPVRGPEGLIGRVLEVSPNTARVLLIVDPESIIPVRRTRDGVPAIVSGRGDGMLDLRSAALANLPFRAGDFFVTSGTGGLYPPGVPVARVVADSRDTARAQPVANPDSLDFAIVERPFLPAPRAAPEAEGATR